MLFLLDETFNNGSMKRFEEFAIYAGHKVLNLHHLDFFSEDIEYDGKIIPIGGTDFVRKAKSIENCITWCDFESLRFSYYWGCLSGYLTNEDHELMKLSELTEDTFGDYDVLFIKPDSIEKPFGARCVKKDELEEFLKYINRFREDILDEDIIVSSKKKIKYEWRIVASKYGIITGSLYRVNGESQIKTGYDPYLNNLFSWLPKYVFDIHPLLIIDFAMEEMKMYNNFTIMKLGSVNSTRYYKCEMLQVLHAMEKQLE